MTPAAPSSSAPTNSGTRDESIRLLTDDATTTGRRPDRWTTSALAAMAAACVAMASVANNGIYSGAGLLWLGAGLILVLLAASGVRVAAIERSGPRALLAVMCGAIALELWGGLGVPPLAPHQSLWPFLNGGGFVVYSQWMIVFVVLLVTVLGLTPAFKWHYVVGLVLFHTLITIWLISHSPSPEIDVWVQAQAACEAFSRGVNPYTITFPNIYGNDAWRFYPEGIVRDGMVHFGYQYMPLSFYPSFISWKLTGDVRYAGLVMVEGAALMIGLMGREPFGRLAMGLLLCMGTVYRLVENAWTETYVVFCLAATVYCVLRKPKLFPWVLGLLLVSKQHMPMAFAAVPLLVGFSPKALWAVAWRAGLVGAIVTLPMVLWDPKAFYHGVFWVQLNNPFRTDAISFATWFYKQTEIRPPKVTEFIAAFAGMALMLWRAPRTAGGFALGIVACYLPLFAFGKQAFTNYWYFTVGSLAIAVSAASSGLVRGGDEAAVVPSVDVKRRSPRGSEA